MAELFIKAAGMSEEESEKIMNVARRIKNKREYFGQDQLDYEVEINQKKHVPRERYHRTHKNEKGLTCKIIQD